MKLKRFLLRYYPPGIILEYELRDKTREMKEIDLLHLTPETDIEVRPTIQLHISPCSSSRCARRRRSATGQNLYL